MSVYSYYELDLRNSGDVIGDIYGFIKNCALLKNWEIVSEDILNRKLILKRSYDDFYVDVVCNGNLIIGKSGYGFNGSSIIEIIGDSLYSSNYYASDVMSYCVCLVNEDSIVVFIFGDKTQTLGFFSGKLISFDSVFSIDCSASIFKLHSGDWEWTKLSVLYPIATDILQGIGLNKKNNFNYFINIAYKLMGSYDIFFEHYYISIKYKYNDDYFTATSLVASENSFSYFNSVFYPYVFLQNYDLYNNGVLYTFPVAKFPYGVTCADYNDFGFYKKVEYESKKYLFTYSSSSIYHVFEVDN